MFFLSITVMNIFIIFLIRILVKKNILFYKLAYLTLIFQILTVIVSLVRKRNLDLISFEVTFFFITLTISLLFLLPIFFNNILSEKKKADLTLLEQNVKLFLLNAYDNFLENKPTLSRFCDKFSKNLTKIIASLVFSDYYFWLVLVPWLLFVNFFLLETVITKAFLFSPYLFVYFLVSYRLLVLLLYITKNTQTYSYKLTLRQNLRCFQSVDVLLSFSTLKDLVLNSTFETKEKRIFAWKELNSFLSLFIDALILKDTFYSDLSDLKKNLDGLNFILISSIFIFFFLNHFFDHFISCYCFLLFFFILSYSFLFSQPVKESSSTAFSEFLTDLPEFIGHFKFVLISEYQFSLKEVDDNFDKPIRLILPTKATKFLISCFNIQVLAILTFFSFWFFGFSFLNFNLSISNFESFVFLHQVIDFIKITLF